jgi:hypothetical protein
LVKGAWLIGASRCWATLSGSFRRAWRQRFVARRPWASALQPGRLNDVINAADHITLVADNFEVLSEELFKVTPTYQNGAPNTLIGPPTSGERVLGELWKDSLGAWWRCTAAGTPGTWQQVLPAAVAADPSSGTVPTGYLVLNVATGCCFGKGARAQDFQARGLKGRTQRAGELRRTDTVGAGMAGDSA